MTEQIIEPYTGNEKIEPFIEVVPVKKTRVISVFANRPKKKKKYKKKDYKHIAVRTSTFIEFRKARDKGESDNSFVINLIKIYRKWRLVQKSNDKPQKEN